MKCYYHPEVDAVALCKSCNRALCLDCAADVHPGTACKNRCEEEVASLNVIIERGKNAYQKTGKAYYRNGWFFLLISIVFIIIGAIPIIVDQDFSGIFLVLLGGIFLMAAFFQFKSGKQIKEI